MVIKRFMLLTFFYLFVFPPLQGLLRKSVRSIYSKLSMGRSLWETNNSDAIQIEAKMWIDTIKASYEVETLLDLGKDGYCLRIPTEPIRVENELMDTTIQDVFLYLGKDHKPVLLLFDVRWPARYLVYFSADIRPFLKELGIWRFVDDKKYAIYNRVLNVDDDLKGGFER